MNTLGFELIKSCQEWRQMVDTQFSEFSQQWCKLIGYGADALYYDEYCLD